MNIQKDSSVQGVREEKNPTIFTTNPNSSQKKEESFLENDIAYARECVEFFDNLDFNNDEVRDDDLDYNDE